jgi:TRAP-type uncharacterized transport system fused permease subunit
MIMLMPSCTIWFYKMISTIYLMQDPMQHQIISLGAMILILFLSIITDTSSTAKKAAYYILMVAGVICAGYLRINYEALQDSLGFPEIPDMAVGAFLIGVVLVGTWSSWGPTFPSLAIVLMLYFFFGHHLPQPYLPVPPYW